MLFDRVGGGGQASRQSSTKCPKGVELHGTRPREYVLTMIVSFSLTFAILMRERITEALPSQTRAPQLLVAAHSEPISSPLTQAAPALMERTLTAAAAAAAAPMRPSLTTAAVNSEGATLPLTYNVYNRRDRGKIEGFVKNMSGQALSVTLQVVDAAGQPTTQVELTLAPAEQKGFGTDSGLDIHSRDRVILHSPPYQDGSMEVP